MKKNKKAFTLIELLAIIVILAIIAVITVPIILGIIDNSRKGAATDSAYGYKDAINKYYLTKSLDDPTFEMENKIYVVDANTGYLKYIDSVNSENNITHEIAISGKIPDVGAVEINNNEIKKACLQFGEYAVTITNGVVGDAVKSTCDGINLVGQQQNTNPLSIDDIAIGDYIKLGNDGFYIVDIDENDKISLLAQYNLKNTGTVANPSWIQWSGDDYYKTSFSSGAYWYGLYEGYWNGSYDSSIVSQAWDYYDENYDRRDFSDGHYVYRTIDNEDTSNNLYQAINNYRYYLENNLRLNIVDVRIISYCELFSIGWSRYGSESDFATGDKILINNQSFWIGTTDDVECHNCMLAIVKNNNYVNSSVGYSDTYGTANEYGIRPFVEMNISDFLNQATIPTATTTSTTTTTTTTTTSSTQS